MAASILETVRKQMASAKAEYRQRRRDLERQIEALDRDYGTLLGLDGAGSRSGRRKSGRGYGAVREAVLGAIKAAKGIKPTQIAEKTGLASQQVHNSLTGLKKAKMVKVKDGLYTAL